jgi:hypothetical protein
MNIKYLQNMIVSQYIYYVCDKEYLVHCQINLNIFLFQINIHNSLKLYKIMIIVFHRAQLFFIMIRKFKQ